MRGLDGASRHGMGKKDLKRFSNALSCGVKERSSTLLQEGDTLGRTLEQRCSTLLSHGPDPACRGQSTGAHLAHRARSPRGWAAGDLQ